MKYSVNREERYTIFELHEENLNSLVAPTLKSEFTIFKNEGVKNFILNLKDVRYIDSSGLSSILTGKRLWQDTGGSFVMCNVQHSNVRKLIEISRLDSVLVILPTLEESIEYVFMSDIEQELNG